MKTQCILAVIAASSLILWPAAARGQAIPAELQGTWTVVIHGFLLYGESGYQGITLPGGWMRGIGDRIATLCSGQANIYTMGGDDFELTSVFGNGNPSDPNRHHVVLFNWSKNSNFNNPLPGGASSDGYAYAAADVLLAFLRARKIEEKLFALIGHSRGAVVASEATRMLIVRRQPQPLQVIYLDAEGRGVNIGTGQLTLFADSQFDAWAGPTSTIVDNVYTSYWESICVGVCLPADLGQGATIAARCHNRDLGWSWSHASLAPFECILPPSCNGNWPPPIQDFLIANLEFSGGLFQIGTSPPPNPEPPADPFGRSAPIIFNGAFEWKSWAGWYWHGAGTHGTGAIVNLNGTGSLALRLGIGESRTHTWFAMPECAARLTFGAAVQDPSGTCGAGNHLRITIEALDGAQVVLGSNFTGCSGELLPVTHDVPPGLRGKICRLHFEFIGGGGGSPRLFLDNVAISPLDASWQQVAALGPPPRNGPMAYDRDRGRAIVVAGSGTNTRDTFEWDGVVWRLAGTAPSAFTVNHNHAMAYDERNQRTVVFGGVGSPSTTWLWNGVSWTQPSLPGGSPPGRWAHSMAYDSRRERVLVFAGNASGNANDLWAWDGVQWSQYTVVGARPSPRNHTAMAFDRDRGVAVVFGGSTSAGFANDTWEWNGQFWVQRDPGGAAGPARPGIRAAHAMAYDEARGVVVMYGGTSAVGASNQYNDTWEWNGVTWKRIVSAPPTGEYFPGMVYEPSGSAVLLFGGLNRNSIATNATWRFRGSCPGGVCYADCNGDGHLNIGDVGCFQTRFALGDPYADCNVDGQLNLADFGCFQTRFALGCP